MNTSVIIPVLNKWDLTRACLESLRARTPAADGEIEVILVDNASSDATPAEAPALGGALFGAGFVYLPQPVNRNFSASCNIGARAATGETLFFLNNDTLLTPGWLPPLLKELGAPGGPSLVGPLLLYPELAGRPDRVQHLGIAFDPQLRAKHLYEGFPAGHPLCARHRRFQAITGAALLIGRETFLACGLFDEDFINGGEDVELGLRLGKAGLVSKVAHESVVYHLSGQTPGIHAHAEHNAKMLRAKAAGCIVPDMLRFAQEDGYAFRLGPSLAGYFAPPDGRAAPDVRSPAAITEFLEREPLWYAGYELLADAREAAGDPWGAADSVFMSLRFREDPVQAARLLALARKTRHSRYAAYAGKILAWYRPQNFAHVLKQAEWMRQFCMGAGRDGEAGLYADWLAKKEEYRKLYE